ncbi:SAM-dependent methyltransferase [Sphingomonas baiyangensis]|uniref:Uncharacterized protein n=1 Tax=Sphingomonas baiyangensis TaxID=2572576 RepID=A0A4U1L3U5_9SPHN|nr:50S ribosomal protein L11 methyltransferase [Sphingomonas baiyangensis]TKD51577.1 hypothetical protein FBR43_13040 [Sphingomonas baiyangensis]
MAMLSVLLHAKGVQDDAVALAVAAIEAAPENMAVRDMIGHAFAVGVQSFHVPMLLDGARNQAYARAIERMVKPGMRVLEIGTGGGLLAMLCAKAGAFVTTCEEQPTIAAMARAIIDRNGLSDRIRVIAKRSNELRIPDDMAAPAELIVHEIFGARLFDEGVTAALRDARARLLVAGAPALPPVAEIRCALARSNEPPRRVGTVEGFDMSLFNLFNVPGRQKPLRRKRDVTYCSAPTGALRMNYETPAPFGPRSETISLMSEGGRIDGIMQWLRLDFGNGDILENDPFDSEGANSWGASLFDLVTPVETARGDIVDVTLSHKDMRLLVDAAVRPGSRARQ